MPVCTRLDVKDLNLLATFKLPQICELGLYFDHPDSNLIWSTDIVVNSNLSGLRLLHVHDWHQDTDLIRILRSLPVLESLILGNGSSLVVKFFRAFVPMSANGTFGLNLPSGEGQISAILCPMLKSLLIEGVVPTDQPELIPVLKEVVSLRAMGGSPLKRFTFYEFWPAAGNKFELIGRDGSVSIEKIGLNDDDKPFGLEI